MTADSSLKVRMYKGLLGDCFLLQLSDGGEGLAKILIDCGMLQGITGGADTMRKVARNIVEDTGGRVDLLVITHRHFDHISGFQYAEDVFKGLTFDNLWLSWAENAGDAQASALWGRANSAAKVVRGVAQHAAKLAALGVAGAEDITAGLAAFLGPQSADGGFGPKVMEDLKRRTAPAYLEPGEVRDTPGAVSLKAYVLGPPRGAKLFDSDPSATDPQTYLTGEGLASVDGLSVSPALLDAIDGRAGDPRPDNAPLPDLFDDDGYALAADAVGEAFDLSPFPPRYSHFNPPRPPKPGDPARDRANEAARDWFTNIYLEGPAWRRIDAAWLGAATRLAERLDRNINNTSLVLAFETPAGRVLLFPGDAQVGNWLSWRCQTYPAGAVGARTADDLLARVIFYKVGHHCSRNATLEGQGLDVMGSPDDLVAMIPLVETYAHAQAGGGWNMPFPALYAALLARTGGRLLRGDAAIGKGPKGESLTADQTFLDRVTPAPDDLYVEYSLPAAQIGGFTAAGSATSPPAASVQ